MTEALRQARLFAEYALLERMPLALPEKREGLRARIARIRAGMMDSAPEVVSARLAVEYHTGEGSERVCHG